MKKPPLKKISRLLAKSLRASERGKACFDQSGAALDAALALGVPLGQRIELPARPGEEKPRAVVVNDQFAAKNTAFSAKMFQRFRIEDWKEPRPAKATETKAL